MVFLILLEPGDDANELHGINPPVLQASRSDFLRAKAKKYCAILMGFPLFAALSRLEGMQIRRNYFLPFYNWRVERSNGISPIEFLSTMGNLQYFAVSPVALGTVIPTHAP